MAPPGVDKDGGFGGAAVQRAYGHNLNFGAMDKSDCLEGTPGGAGGVYGSCLRPYVRTTGGYYRGLYTLFDYKMHLMPWLGALEEQVHRAAAQADENAKAIAELQENHGRLVRDFNKHAQNSGGLNTELKYSCTGLTTRQKEVEERLTMAEGNCQSLEALLKKQRGNSQELDGELAGALNTLRSKIDETEKQYQNLMRSQEELKQSLEAAGERQQGENAELREQCQTVAHCQEQLESQISEMTLKVKRVTFKVKRAGDQAEQVRRLLGIGKPFECSRFLELYNKLAATTRKPEALNKDTILEDVRAMLTNASPYNRELLHTVAVEITMQKLERDTLSAASVEAIISVVWSTDIVMPKILSTVEIVPGMEVELDVVNHGVCTATILRWYAVGDQCVHLQWTGTEGPAGLPSTTEVLISDWDSGRARLLSGRPEICSVLGHVIRTEDELGMPGAVGLCLALREFTGKARQGFAVSWPLPNADGVILVTRGGGITHEMLKFFRARLDSPSEIGEWYRPAMPLATAKSVAVSDRFIHRTHRLHPDWQLVRFVISIDGCRKCLHANFVTDGKFGTAEQEIVFAPYSPMRVMGIKLSGDPTNPDEPHIIELQAAPDGKDFPDLLPTATFH